MNIELLLLFLQFGRLFPLAHNEKRPMPRWNWKAKNTDDPEILSEWLEAYPEAPWALVPDRTFVVDVDRKSGSDGSRSIEDAGGLTPTLTVQTPSGGSHHYYALDPEMPCKTRNSWLEGVDIRYGGDGYVVIAGSTTHQGTYAIVDGLNLLDGSRLGSSSILPPVPTWIKSRWIEQATTVSSNPGYSNATRDSKNTLTPPGLYQYTEDDRGWLEGTIVPKSMSFRFFHRSENAKKNLDIWNNRPITGMIDKSQSAMEFQLACALMCVGATDEQCLSAYQKWVVRNGLPNKEQRFVRNVIPKARIRTADYINEWLLSQPVRRKQGTTTLEIVQAIRQGHVRPKDIVAFTGLKGSTVRMQLRRLLHDGMLTRTDAGYAIADVLEAVDASVGAWAA